MLFLPFLGSKAVCIFQRATQVPKGWPLRSHCLLVLSLFAALDPFTRYLESVDKEFEESAVAGMGKVNPKTLHKWENKNKNGEPEQIVLYCEIRVEGCKNSDTGFELLGARGFHSAFIE